MKKILLFAVALATLAACQASLEDKCERETKAYTEKNCPSQLGENLYIDSMTFERSTHTLAFHYRVSGQLEHMDNQYKQVAVEMLTNEVRNSTHMKAYKDAGYTIVYFYRAASHPDSLLLKVELTEADYK